jgi:hypothetical protein
MSTSFSFRRIRGVAATTLALALFAIPAMAIAGNGSSARASLAGPGAYCQDFNGLAAASVGKIQLSTTPAASEGFHAVHVDIKVGPGTLQSGSYDVYLVNLYRDDSGEIVGCSASQLSSAMTVRSNRWTDFRGTATRYTGEYELQVYVGPIWGSGYASAPATVDVP